MTAPSDERRVVGVLRSLYPGLRSIWSYTLSPVDAYSVLDGVLVEIKSRTKHYNDLVLERKKLERMQQLAYDLDMSALYVCETPQGIWYWDVTTLVPEYTGAEMNYDTVEGRPKIVKEVTYLKIANGTKIF